MQHTSSRRPGWLLPAVGVVAALATVGLWLTQPWLLLVDEVADERLPITAVPADEAAPVVEPTSATTPSTEPRPRGPVVLARGSFVSRDHETTGEVALVRLEDGSRVLTIEDLDTDNGPDLHVHLDDDPADAPEDDFDDGTDLGLLRANQGNLVYEVPDDLDLDGIASVAIWCDRFSSLFGAADLDPVG